MMDGQHKKSVDEAWKLVLIARMEMNQNQETFGVLVAQFTPKRRAEVLAALRAADDAVMAVMREMLPGHLAEAGLSARAEVTVNLPGQQDGWAFFRERDGSVAMGVDGTAPPLGRAIKKMWEG